MENLDISLLRVVELETALADIHILTIMGNCGGNPNLSMIKGICERLICK